MVFDFKFDVFLEAFLCTYTCKQPLGTNLDIGGSKFGFLGEKGVGTWEKLCRADNWSLKRAVSEH